MKIVECNEIGSVIEMGEIIGHNNDLVVLVIVIL